jgi:hypothetical protein
MSSRIASSLTAMIMVATCAATPLFTTSIAMAGAHGNGGFSGASDAAVRIAQNYNCGGRAYDDEARQFYDFVPEWHYSPGYWVGPIDHASVAWAQAHFRCPDPAAARVLLYGGTPYRVSHRRFK